MEQDQYGFSSADAKADTSANKQYKAAQAKGFKGSFAEFLESKKAHRKELLGKGLDLLSKAADTVAKIKGSGSAEPASAESAAESPAKAGGTKIFGMSPIVAGVVGIGVLTLVIVGVRAVMKARAAK